MGQCSLHFPECILHPGKTLSPVVFVTSYFDKKKKHLSNLCQFDIRYKKSIGFM
jgi:hypothetical protein